MGRKKNVARPSTSLDRQHSPYTVEGQVEGVRRFGAGVRRAPTARRRIGLVMVAIVLLPIPIYLVQLVARAIW
ncbi:MAG: hypothetical protein ACRDJO_10615 [Actinomycetota bacterium]